MKDSLFYKMAFPPEEECSFESAEVEYEIEIYLEGLDIDTVASIATSVEEQEQWGVFVPKCDENVASGSIRVRKTMSVEGGEKYVQTVKTTSNEAVGQLEHEVEVDKALFNQLSQLADQGLAKTRFTVPYVSPNGHELVIEVDVFRNAKGSIVPWTKLDIELPQGVTYVDTGITLESLPFKFEKIIMINPEMKTSEDSKDKSTLKRVKEIYEDYFVSKNKHI